MRVLMTGASGLIGVHLTPALVRAGFEVHATSRERPVEADGAAWHKCDLMDDVAIADLVRAVGPAYLVHCAWCVTPGTVWWDAANLDWCAATLRLVRHFTEAGGQRAVLVGTCAEYDWSGSVCDEESTRLQPATLYGRAKDSCRSVLEVYAAHAGLSLAWVRLFNMYGPHENGLRLVASAISTLLRGGRFACTDGTQIRDFLHVEDVAEGLTAVLASAIVGAVNVGAGTSVTIRRVLEEIGSQLGALDRIDFGALPRARGEPGELVPALTRLHSAVSWRPRYGLAEGIADTIRWQRRSTTTAK